MPDVPTEFHSLAGKPISNLDQMLNLIIKASREIIRSIKKELLVNFLTLQKV